MADEGVVGVATLEASFPGTSREGRPLLRETKRERKKLTHTGYFLVGGKGGNLPPLTAVFPPFRLAVIIVYYIFQKGHEVCPMQMYRHGKGRHTHGITF